MYDVLGEGLREDVGLRSRSMYDVLGEGLSERR